MTWPFENDTSVIVKKLAKRNVSSNRIFCFFNVLTIALAISLIVGISLFQQGSKISEQKILNQMQQATIGGLTAEQIEVLKKEPDLEDIVPYKHSDSFLMDGIKFEAVYMPTGFGIIKSYELVSGTCPEQYNEIVIDKNVQLELGYQLNIGDTITLPTAGSKTEDFIITGFTDNVETGTFYFYVSPAYAEQGVLLSDIPYSALIRVNGATEMGLIDFENTVYRLALSQDISRNQLYFNSKFCSSLISGSGMGGVLLATLFIAFSSGIVIYSVFYLSVSNQVSQIGQLKTIGMTEKQIKRMIRKEGYRFCLFGIPAGITVGIIFAYLLEPNGITIINAIATSIFAIILGIIIVQISVYKPAQIASNISPIEATKYVGNDPELKESRVCNRKNHIRLSPYSLAVLSEKQNRKKHNLTIASLAIGGILFVRAKPCLPLWSFSLIRKTELWKTNKPPAMQVSQHCFSLQKKTSGGIINVGSPTALIYTGGIHMDNNSLSHTKWNCKYHIVFAPKYRRKVAYGKIKQDIADILSMLCKRKGVKIVEAEICPDHVHMLVEIPPSISVSYFVGYLKGKSTLMIFERHANLKYKYGNRHFWCRGYYVDTVGKNAKKMQEYIANQLQDDLEYDQMTLKEYIDPFTGEPVKRNK